MSIATGLLLAGAVGIMLVMHLVGRGGHSRSRGINEAEGPEMGSACERRDSSQEGPRGGHGCC